MWRIAAIDRHCSQGGQRWRGHGWASTSVRAAPLRRVPCGARARGPVADSLRALRALRSDNRAEVLTKRAGARGHGFCAPQRCIGAATGSPRHATDCGVAANTPVCSGRMPNADGVAIGCSAVRLSARSRSRCSGATPAMMGGRIREVRRRARHSWRSRGPRADALARRPRLAQTRAAGRQQQCRRKRQADHARTYRVLEREDV